ncbi:MAG: (2Fe-2S)-binding protein [Oscillospiraceae bacterium]|nr:(2Fe-2S)-binding protein [Oscillospiraceae bacterium]
MRINDHPIFGEIQRGEKVSFTYDGKTIEAYEGESIAAALWASGNRVLRYTHKLHEPRGLFCAIGYCSDCLMIVDGVPNTRTCVTMVKNGMKVEIQNGYKMGGI